MIIQEATRILENRIRKLAGVDDTFTGMELAKEVFGGSQPILRATNIAAEQDAVHLLYRGVFGFIRNPFHHKLIGEMAPERVLQILALIDYLLFVAEDCKKDAPHSPPIP